MKDNIYNIFKSLELPVYDYSKHHDTVNNLTSDMSYIYLSTLQSLRKLVITNHTMVIIDECNSVQRTIIAKPYVLADLQRHIQTKTKVVLLDAIIN